MSGGPDPLYLHARAALLDVVDALREPAGPDPSSGRRLPGPETVRWPDPIGGRGTSRYWVARRPRDMAPAHADPAVTVSDDLSRRPLNRFALIYLGCRCSTNLDLEAVGEVAASLNRYEFLLTGRRCPRAGAGRRSTRSPRSEVARVKPDAADIACGQKVAAVRHHLSSGDSTRSGRPTNPFRLRSTQAAEPRALPPSVYRQRTMRVRPGATPVWSGYCRNVRPRWAIPRSVPCAW